MPVPPELLIRRAGCPPGGDARAEHLAVGASNKQLLLSVLPPEWSFDGKRILDFGCGVGKVLRHFAPEAAIAEFWGCDIDDASIAWLSDNLCPPFHVFRNDEVPPLAADTAAFDLVYAISVFTHITDSWSEWLLELHRVIKPGGLLVASLLGEGMSEMERAGPWDEALIGMNVLRTGQDWAGGGPTVFHSRWWVESHWGRLFEIVGWHESRDESGQAIQGAHNIVVARRPDGDGCSLVELEALEPHEPREIAALKHNIEQLHEDDRRLRAELAAAVDRGDREHARRVAAERASEASPPRSTPAPTTKLTKAIRRFTGRPGSQS